MFGRVLLLLVVGYVSIVQGYNKGDCLCLRQDTDVRFTACGEEIGEVYAGYECFKYQGQQIKCVGPGGRGSYFLKIDLYNKDRWIAEGDVTLDDDDSKCDYPSLVEFPDDL